MESSSISITTYAESERFQLFVASITDYALYMLSPEGFVCSWNAGAQRFKGYAAGEIKGQHFSRFYTEEDKAGGLPSRALQTAASEGKFEDEGWRVRKDGSRFWASVVIDPIRDARGKLIGFAKITRDITERKEAAEALHASEEQFRLLVESVTDYAIYMLSPEGTITNWNTGALRITGLSQRDAVGSNFSRFYTEGDRTRGLPIAALETARTKGHYDGEGWRLRKDGSRFWASVAIDPIRNGLGELIGYVKITRDITEKREAGLALERAKEALFQSQKLDAIGKLTGGVAHDFNNVLNVIVNGMEILAREAQTPASIRMLESMKRAAAQGTALTQQLLAFARKQPLKQDTCDLNQVIRSFEPMLEKASKGCVDFSLELDPLLPTVIIDVSKLEAALLNLIINARDATPDGGAITLSTAQVDLRENEAGELPAGRYVKVTVRDTGHGMPPEVAAQAVEPFFTTKEVGKGTGLGLSQVYGTIKQFGGEIIIETAVGEGTAISLILPVLEGSAGKSSTDRPQVMERD